MDTENPLPEAEILKTMPTDETIAKLYRAVEGMQEKDQVVEQWGTAIQWTDFHTSDPFRVDYD
jgi:hypothetical protein